MVCVLLAVIFLVVVLVFAFVGLIFLFLIGCRVLVLVLSFLLFRRRLMIVFEELLLLVCCLFWFWSGRVLGICLLVLLGFDVLGFIDLLVVSVWKLVAFVLD